MTSTARSASLTLSRHAAMCSTNLSPHDTFAPISRSVGEGTAGSPS